MNINTTKKGFTLVEMLVALMIFSMVVTVALAALVKIVDANKKAQTIQDSVTNLSFAMESMARELRNGSAYYCRVLSAGAHLSVTSLSSQDIATCTGTSGNSSSGVGFAFLSNRSGGACMLINAYEVVPNLTNGQPNGTFSFNKASQTSCGAALNFSPVVATSTVTITNYFVQMNNTQFPLAFINLDGNAGTKEVGKSYFTIQTASTPRIP